jgi:hypothetical protein
VKIREGLAANDYKDPGDYKHPPGTVAYEVASSSAPTPPRKRPRNPAESRPQGGQTWK